MYSPTCTTSCQRRIQTPRIQGFLAPPRGRRIIPVPQVRGRARSEAGGPSRASRGPIRRTCPEAACPRASPREDSRRLQGGVAARAARASPNRRRASFESCRWSYLPRSRNSSSARRNSLRLTRCVSRSPTLRSSSRIPSSADLPVDSARSLTSSSRLWAMDSMSGK